MKGRRVLLIVVLALAVLLLLLLTHRNPTPLQSSSQCDASLWEHVYHSQRLQVIDACKVVEGTVVSLRNEADGDVHIPTPGEPIRVTGALVLDREHGWNEIHPVSRMEILR
jgi:hypothetical protein